MKWTAEMIGDKIMEAKNALGIEYMPTRKQLIQYYGDDCLTNKVSKTLGYYGWAERLGLRVQNNDTRKGKLGEEWAAEYLRGRGFEVQQMLQNYPFDLLVNGCVKVDVKFSNLYRNESGFAFYSFAIRKRIPTSDAYFLIAQDGVGNRKVYILPSAAAKQTQISIGENHSMYDKYLWNTQCLKRIESAFLWEAV